MGKASDSHIALAMTISTSVLIGGCLLLFVENQHVESEIASRYHSVMRPFYHRFTQFIKIISKFVLSIRSEDEEGRKVKEEIKDKTSDLRGIASRSIMSGDEPLYLKAAQIEALCEQINDIWYYFGKKCDLYSHLFLDNNVVIMDSLKKLIVEYDHSFGNENLSLHTFPRMCGDFYCDVWQPVQNVPYSYENFIKKVEICKLYFTVSIAIEVVCVVLLLFSDVKHNISICDFYYKFLQR